MGGAGDLSEGEVYSAIRRVHVRIHHCRGTPSQSLICTAVTDLIQIFTGSFLWEDLNETEVKSRILNGERPSRPEGKKKHALATNLWRIFAKCWGKDPAGRVSVYETLDILRYMWVLTSFVYALPVDFSDGSSPRRSGSYNSKMVVAGGKDHQSQEQIDELDKVGYQLPSPHRPKLIDEHRCWTRTWCSFKSNPSY